MIFGLVALLCLLIFGFRFLDLFLGFFPEPGLRPAAQSLPFASPKASNQVKGDPTAPDPSLREGQPASRQSRGALRNSRRASRSGQTVATSQMTKLLRHLTQQPPRDWRDAGVGRRAWRG